MDLLEEYRAELEKSKARQARLEQQLAAQAAVIRSLEV